MKNNAHKWLKVMISLILRNSTSDSNAAVVLCLKYNTPRHCVIVHTGAIAIESRMNMSQSYTINSKS